MQSSGLVRLRQREVHAPPPGIVQRATLRLILLLRPKAVAAVAFLVISPGGVRIISKAESLPLRLAGMEIAGLGNNPPVHLAPGHRSGGEVRGPGLHFCQTFGCINTQGAFHLKLIAAEFLAGERNTSRAAQAHPLGSLTLQHGLIRTRLIIIPLVHQGESHGVIAHGIHGSIHRETSIALQLHRQGAYLFAVAEQLSRDAFHLRQQDFVILHPADEPLHMCLFTGAVQRAVAEEIHQRLRQICRADSLLHQCLILPGVALVRFPIHLPDFMAQDDTVLRRAELQEARLCREIALHQSILHRELAQRIAFGIQQTQCGILHLARSAQVVGPAEQVAAIRLPEQTQVRHLHQALVHAGVLALAHRFALHLDHVETTHRLTGEQLGQRQVDFRIERGRQILLHRCQHAGQVISIDAVVIKVLVIQFLFHAGIVAGFFIVPVKAGAGVARSVIGEQTHGVLCLAAQLPETDFTTLHAAIAAADGGAATKLHLAGAHIGVDIRSHGTK